MKRLILAVVMLLGVFVPSVYANSVLAFNVKASSMPFSPDFGTGDNEFYFLDGPPGTSISGSGTVRCDWCSGFTMHLPGSSVTPDLGLVTFDSVNFIELGGQMVSDAALFNSSITALGSFTFPTNGVGTFTVRVPAAFSGPIQGSGDFPNFNSFNLNVASGQLVLTFDFVPALNGVPANYIFSQGNFVSTVPEPGTLGMMAMGLAGIIVGIIQRKRNCRSPV
jgi:PEP-CTERM motif